MSIFGRIYGAIGNRIDRMFGGVPAEPVDTNHHDCVTRPGIVQQSTEAGSLLTS